MTTRPAFESSGIIPDTDALNRIGVGRTARGGEALQPRPKYPYYSVWGHRVITRE